MKTIINNTTPTSDSSSLGLIIGIIALIGFTIFFIYFGLPMIRNMSPIQLKVPAPQVVVPDKIDVNIKQSK